jgi:prepilin-type N-terminal cleavage/methylation domain-containing protein
MSRACLSWRSRAGVTLMELLIAISLVSLLSVGILMAIRVGLNAMEKANSRLMGNRRVVGAQRVLEQQIAGFMAVAADCRPAPDAPPVRMGFFQGEPDSMRFVSSYSLQEASRGYPRILEYQVIPGENNEGVRLVVNELLYTGPLSTGALCLGPGPPDQGLRFRPIEVGPQSFVLADRLAFCRFSYQELRPPPELRRWVPRWVTRQLPVAVRIEMAPLQPDPARLPLLTFTAPIHVDKNPLTQYAD